ncbi:MAG: hypothetical protein LW595_05120 [Rickettsiales bacterium]|nr:hypothetical protein [Rickettsiales bacterium]
MAYKIAKLFENNKLTDKFHLKEHDKVFTGRIQISNKIKDKWVNKAMSFVFFKNSDLNTVNFFKNYDGSSFQMDFDLTLDKMPNSEDAYIKIIIKKTWKEVDKHSTEKGNGYAPENNYFNDEIPF